MKKLAVLSLVLIVLLATTVLGCAKTPEPAAGNTAPVQTIEWKIQGTMPTGMLIYQSLLDFAKCVNEESDGRLVIKDFPAGAVVGANDELEGINKGLLDGLTGALASYKGTLGLVSDLFCQYPGCLTPAEYMIWYSQRGGLEMLQECLDEKAPKVKALGPSYLMSSEDEMWSNKKIVTLDDFKGLKIRTFGDWGTILTNLGASVITLAPGEVFESLQRGVIDACEMGDPAVNWSLGLHQVCKYVHEPGIHSPSCCGQMLVSKESFAKLPPDLQAIVQNSVRRAAWQYWTLALNAGIEAAKEREAYGVETVVYSVELQRQILDACDSLLAKNAAADPFYKKVLESQQALAADNAKLSGIVDPNMALLRSE